MYEDYFANRLTELRINKGVSARDMSLSIGQSESYINKIENKKSFPSMQIFFYICEYLGVTPKEFFEDDINNPIAINNAVNLINKLNPEQFDNIIKLIQGLVKD